MPRTIRYERLKPCCKVALGSLTLCFCLMAYAQLPPEQLEQQVERAVGVEQQVQEIRRLVELRQAAQEGKWEVSPPPVGSLPRANYKEWLRTQGAQCEQRMFE